MTRVHKWLGGTAAAVLLLGAAGISTQTAEAQSPPNLPAIFAGSVTVDGAPAAAGASIVAQIDGNNCGVSSVFIEGGEARYTINVSAALPENNNGCGTEGDTVTFFVDGEQANETGEWINYDLNLVNLTVDTDDETPTETPTETETPTVTVTPGDDDDDNGDDDGDDDDDNGGATSTATPKAPATGTGANSAGAGNGTMLVAVLGGAMLTLTAGGALAVRRSR